MAKRAVSFVDKVETYEVSMYLKHTFGKARLHLSPEDLLELDGKEKLKAVLKTMPREEQECMALGRAVRLRVEVELYMNEEVPLESSEQEDAACDAVELPEPISSPCKEKVIFDAVEQESIQVVVACSPSSAPPAVKRPWPSLNQSKKGKGLATEHAVSLDEGKHEAATTTSGAPSQACVAEDADVQSEAAEAARPQQAWLTACEDEVLFGIDPLSMQYEQPENTKRYFGQYRRLLRA
eukprot:TRINITY_DN63636_c0_g1_i1.p1 TRINITY_DN63636_c0_g1~~TRINITY_DN63636_c0_g1_i1.p1  ORF type:complete len:238 (-),score=54.65 TRINITY_DN63636_c0_g1_i1:456-1169(-)